MVVYINTNPDAYVDMTFKDELWNVVDGIIASGGRILTWLDNKGVLIRCHAKGFNNVGLSGTMVEKIEECDYAVCCWDGIRQVEAMEIMLVLVMGKPCRMYYIPLKLWFDINSFDDLRRFINERSCWTPEEEKHLTDIVCGSSLSLEEKRDVLGTLCEYGNYVYAMFDLAEGLLKSEAELKEKCQKLIRYRSYPYMQERIDKLYDAIFEKRIKEEGS